MQPVANTSRSKVITVSHARYDPKQVTGDQACPYNSLYWHFIDRHRDVLSQNPRMGLIMGGWRKRASSDREAVVQWGEQMLRAATQPLVDRAAPHRYDLRRRCPLQRREQ